MPGSEPDYDHATPLEHITFDGNGSEDVTIFLQSVKRVALVQGRQRDDDWIVDYTEASLTGDALRWFSDLDEGALRSWRTVRNAFLKRFSAPVVRLAHVPAPAAPAIAPAAMPRVATSQLSKHPKPYEVLQSSLMGATLYKTLYVGNSGVGKSCVMSRAVGGGWARDMSPTEGVAYETHSAGYSDTMSFEFHEWDASGTLHWETLASQYTATLDRVIIVYDVTNQSSFDSKSAETTRLSNP
ncbi:Ras- protein Rab-1A [Tulasnella sp. JGI-2019a]|nr:Ras- protein Rab-1A [Tulasnella sp. JGI-2019a]